jgi:hypothetical protein
VPTVVPPGIATYVSTSVSLTTITENAPGFFNVEWTDTAIPVHVVQPFPTGDFSNWSYIGFIAENGLNAEMGGENIFNLPVNVPGFLAGVPAVVSTYPDIGMLHTEYVLMLALSNPRIMYCRPEPRRANCTHTS